MLVPLQTRRQVHPWRRLHKVRCSVCCHTPVRKHGKDIQQRCKMGIDKKRNIDLFYTSKEYVASWVPDWASLPYTSISSTSSVKPKTSGLNTDWHHTSGSNTHFNIKLEHTGPVGGRFYSLLFAWWFLLEFINEDLV